MTGIMTIKEVEDSLPNGFHDSYINSIKIDFNKREAEIDFAVDYSSTEKESEPIYHSGKLTIKGLFLFSFEPLSANNLELFPLWVCDSGNINPELCPKWLNQIEAINKNLYYFYFSNLNCYMYIGGKEAEWILIDDC